MEPTSDYVSDSHLIGKAAASHARRGAGDTAAAGFSVFWSSGVRTTPDHKFGRAHLKNVASRGAKLKFWKIEFLQLFHSKSGALYAKTPHFRAVFSVLHLSSTHLGPRWETRTPDILLPNFWIKIFLLFPTLYSRFYFITDALCNSYLHCLHILHGCL